MLLTFLSNQLQFLDNALSIDPEGEFSFSKGFDFYGCNDRRVKKE